MARYIRKTEDVWLIQQLTNYGWEDVNAETSRTDAKRSIKEYRDNQPGAYRIKKTREPLAA